ncbi:hypothetical protein LTR64_002877 [Lithohypha guttulata]|uniref:uncharacterized protein n=1 Tax=Lithohypha guttulata TaxID=1690604 RepID=UPI002DE11B90|nr:hypothetical protein LTR51_000899 [Lithohypha guttulata]
MAETLSPVQASALLDILTHHDTYAEIRDFRKVGALETYGPPFTSESKRLSTAPALQALVSRFVLVVPGLKDVPSDFWKVQIRELIEDLEAANLSESYDKGTVGSRKTLSTAISALIEYPVRGTYGGFAEVDDDNDKYNLQSAEDLARGFRNFVDQCIYGSVLDDLVKKAGETDKLEEHTNMIKAVHEFVLVNLASFMHYTLVLSPKGQYLLKLIDNANKLVPYMAIKQTLRIGNIATMISGLVKIVLTKVSIGSLTNWIGLTATENDGMNLLQQVISTVLNWDVKDLESRVSKITKDKKCPSKEVLNALDKYITLDLEKQESLRKHSQESSTSIVLTILADAGTASDIKEDTHKLALDYLACKLSIRDRNELVKVACHRHPDHLTTMVRTLFDAYEPVIRGMHNAVDLSDTVGDLQAFVVDMLKVGRIQPAGKDGQTVIPSVGDFILLLRKHQFATHKFIHQLCKNGGEVTRWYLDWAKYAASRFQRESSFVDATESQSAEDLNTTEADKASDAGDLTQSLQQLFRALPSDSREKILSVLDNMVAYINAMHSSSLQRLSDVIRSAPTDAAKGSSATKAIKERLTLSRTSSRANSPARPATPSPKDAQAQTQNKPTSVSHDDGSEVPHVSSNPGPGAYLARWQDLLDSTPITPLTLEGKPNRASDKVIWEKSATDADGGKTVVFESNGKNNVVDAQTVKPDVPGGGTKGKKGIVKKPDVKIVIDALGEDFRKLLAEKSLDW